MGGRGGGSPASRQAPAAVATPAGPVEPSRPPGVRPNSVAWNVWGAQTRQQARQMMSNLTLGQLRQAATDLGMKGFKSQSRDDLRESIIEFTVGNRAL